MKYFVVLGDGMADYPMKELNDKTPLEYARTPNFDLLARSSEMGMARTVPEGMPPGSDVANLSVLGYDPALYYTGRSPFEALSMGVDLLTTDVAFRCNLVTLSDDSIYEKRTLVDYSSGEISTAEAAQLIKSLKDRLSSNLVDLYPGVSYRHLLVWHNGREDVKLTPPHDIPNRVIADYLPRGEGSELLLQFMKDSIDILSQHEVNVRRVEEGLRPANSMWFWGQGRKPSLPSFELKYGLKGSVISAVDLTKGIGICAGLKVVDVTGATGNITTNFLGKARVALDEVRSGQDFVYIHVEAPDEAGHQGDLETKIRAIEEIDEKVVGELMRGMKGLGEFKILLMPDHPTPISVRTHTAEEVPFLIFSSSGVSVTGPNAFSEQIARHTGRVFSDGHLLMDHFLK